MLQCPANALGLGGSCGFGKRALSPRLRGVEAAQHGKKATGEFIEALGTSWEGEGQARKRLSRQV